MSRFARGQQAPTAGGARFTQRGLVAASASLGLAVAASIALPARRSGVQCRSTHEDGAREVSGSGCIVATGCINNSNKSLRCQRGVPIVYGHVDLTDDERRLMACPWCRLKQTAHVPA